MDFHVVGNKARKDMPRKRKKKGEMLRHRILENAE